MQRNGIVECRGDAILREMLPQAVSILRLDDVEVIDVVRVAVADRRCYPVDVAQELAVERSHVSPLLRPSAQVLELGCEHRALNGLHPIVVPDRHVVIARDLAVRPQQLRTLIERFVVGDQRACLAERAEVLAGIEAEGRDRAEVADLDAPPAREMRLSRILDDLHVELRGERAETRHVGGATV